MVSGAHRLAGRRPAAVQLSALVEHAAPAVASLSSGPMLSAPATGAVAAAAAAAPWSTSTGPADEATPVTYGIRYVPAPCHHVAPYRSFASSATRSTTLSPSTPPAQGCQTDIDDVRYHREADHTLDVMFEEFERMIEEADMLDADVELSQGVLTLKLGALGTYVINKQAPNRQLWVSSPVSGPMRYDFARGFWVNMRGGDEGRFLHEVLQDELIANVGFEVDLSPCSHCSKDNACLNTYDCTR